jgi:DNA repair protein RadC
MDSQYIAITKWAEEDRPREKMLLKGVTSLSDAELIAILIGSGTVGESAVALAQRILATASHNLHELGRFSIKDFEKFKGIGEAKAVTIAAALELGRRRQSADALERPRIGSSHEAWEIIGPQLMDLAHEEFWLLLLSRKHEVIRKVRMSTGGSGGTVVDTKMVLRAAIEYNASAFIAVHNHPSGTMQPSRADIELTRRLIQAGKALEIPMLDHLIVANKKYYSFADEGQLVE